MLIKNIYITKNLTDFSETVETGVDPRLRSFTGREAKRKGVKSQWNLIDLYLIRQRSCTTDMSK